MEWMEWLFLSDSLYKGRFKADKNKDMPAQDEQGRTGDPLPSRKRRHIGNRGRRCLHWRCKKEKMILSNVKRLQLYLLIMNASFVSTELCCKAEGGTWTQPTSTRRFFRSGKFLSGLTLSLFWIHEFGERLAIWKLLASGVNKPYQSSEWVLNLEPRASKEDAISTLPPDQAT